MKALIRALEERCAAGGEVLGMRTCFPGKGAEGRTDDFSPEGRGDVAEGALREVNNDVVAQPWAWLLQKTRLSPFAVGDLPQRLDARGARTAVTAGPSPWSCIQATTDALMMGDYRVVLLENACASRPTSPVSAWDGLTYGCQEADAFGCGRVCATRSPDETERTVRMRL
ncbi:isochorismatase family protein [Nocardia sp. NPDC004718]